MVSRGHPREGGAGERGAALLIALLTVVLLATAVALASNLVVERQRALDRETATLRLNALFDAALAETLARMAADLGAGVPEHELGEGRIGSEVAYLSSEEAEVRVHAELRGARRGARAQVDLSGERPRVTRWERLAADPP